MSIWKSAQLISVNEFGKARMIAIKLKLSEQVIDDAIRYKREEFPKIDRAWGHQFEWDRFWNPFGFRRKDKWLKTHIHPDL